MSREQRDQSSIMAPKKDKSNCLEEKGGFLKRIQEEVRGVRAETSSMKESLNQKLTELDDIQSEIAQTREINERVILRNTRTHQLLDLVNATTLTGSGSVPEQEARPF